MVMATESPLNENLPETFWAWLAGFVDGDGTIVFERIKQTPNVRIALSIAQKDRRPLDWIREKLGTGSVFHSSPNDVHHIRFGPSASRRIITKMQPYLQLPDKVERAERALGWEAIGSGQRSNSPEKQSLFAEVCRRYSTGNSSGDIANELGLPQKQVARWVSRASLTRTPKQAANLRGRKARGQTKQSKHSEARAKALSMWELGTPQCEIARALGLRGQYINYWIKSAERERAGEKIRP